MDFIKNIEYVMPYTTEAKFWHTEKNRPVHFIAGHHTGECTHYLENGKIFCAKPGKLLFLNGKDGYEAERIGKLSSITIAFSCDNAPESKIVDSLEADKILEETLFLFDKPDEKSRLLCYANLYKLMAIIAGENEYFSDRRKNIAEKIKSYIDLHFSEEVNSFTISEIAKMSVRGANELFSSRYGTTPMKYVLQKRISKAKALLAEKKYSVGDVALLCGYNDQCYFSRIFSKQTGMSPKEYAKLMT